MLICGQSKLHQSHQHVEWEVIVLVCPTLHACSWAFLQLVDVLWVLFVPGQ